MRVLQVIFLILISVAFKRYGGVSPVLLGKGVLSTDRIESSIAFSPDEKTAYVVRQSGKWSAKDNAPSKIYQYQWINGSWEMIGIAFFSDPTTKDSDSDIFLTSDGRAAFFISTRSYEGKEDDNPDIFRSIRKSSGWTKPEPVTAVNSSGYEASPVTDEQGNLYFSSVRKSGLGDIYMSNIDSMGLYGKPVLLSGEINSRYGEWNLIVSPQANWIIFESSGRNDGLSPYGDLYLSYCLEHVWSRPIPLSIINTTGSELNPRILAKSNKLVFASTAEFDSQDCNLYEISLKELFEDERLRSFDNNNESISIPYVDSIVVNKILTLDINNGLTVHPNADVILISKPSFQMDSTKKSPFYRIYELSYQNSKWSNEVEVSFAGEYNDYHPVFSPDGKWVFFNSDRPVPDSHTKSDKINIWRVQNNGGEWSSPEYLTEINTSGHDSYPSVTNNGTLYFNSDREGGSGSMDIYKANRINGKFAAPVALKELNSMDSENDMVVDPKERFIIFNRYHFKTKEIDLYISYNQNGNWSKPKPLNVLNKPGVWELTPTLSPDGKYFFYEENGRVKVIDAERLMNE